MIYFEIDEKQGMLNSKMVAGALDIPLTSPNPAEIQLFTQTKAAEMGRIVSQNQYTCSAKERNRFQILVLGSCPTLQCLSLSTRDAKTRTYTRGII